MSATVVNTPPGNRQHWLPSYILVNALLSSIPVLLNLQWPSAADARLFVAMMQISQMGLLALACCLPGWLCAAITPLRALALPLCVGATTLCSALMLVDARVFHQFGFHINGLVIALLFDGGLLDQLGLPPRTWLAALLVLVAILCLQLALALVLQCVPRRFALKPGHLALLLPLTVACHAMAIWYDARGRADAMASLRAIPWLHTATARQRLDDWGWVTSDAGVLDLALPKPVAGTLGYAQTPLRCHAERPMNVLLLVIDSLRHDMLNPQQMPNASRFAGQAMRAEQHYSSGNNTMHGLFGLFYGLPALHARSMMQARRGPELLRYMAPHHYQYYLYGGASLHGARLDRAVFAEIDAPLHTAADTVPKPQRDRHVVQQMQQALQAHPHDRPFLGFLLLDSAHIPYSLPADAEQRFLPQAASGDHLRVHADTDPTLLFNRYRNAVLHADALIGEVLQTLQDTGRAEDTIVVITGDHGESFNDLHRNDWGHNNNFSDYQTRVPFLLRWPGRPASVQTAATSHMDLAPTLMRHLLSCSNPLHDYAAGMDLFSPLPAQRPLLVESWTSRGVRVGAQTWLVQPHGIEVLDAHYNADPDAVRTPELTAAIIGQMQLPPLQPPAAGPRSGGNSQP